MLIIREAKFHKSRLVPFDPSVTAALRSYARLRDRIVLRAKSDRFFLFDNGRPAIQRDIRYALRALCARLGWQPGGDYKHHRLQDTRHTFVVHSILRFYEQGIEIDRAVVALSTYVGHAHVADTYWYATGIPELMNIAAERFHQLVWHQKRPLICTINPPISNMAPRSGSADPLYRTVIEDAPVHVPIKSHTVERKYPVHRRTRLHLPAPAYSQLIDRLPPGSTALGPR